ncbi:sugar phosphate isomerase/epimerase [bacterium]|nr:sugar phosphate isomerase/epimerase [bacterium]
MLADMKPLNFVRFLGGTCILLLCVAWSLQAADSSALKPSERAAFFPFCIDWHDSKKRDLDQQAQMLKELGYEGVGHIWLDKLAERIKSLDAAGLKLFQITITVDITPGKQAYDPRLREAMALVKGRGVQFCLLVNGMKPSDPAGDARAVEILNEMANLTKGTGAQLLLYPHVDNWLERVQDCVRVAEKVNRPEVGVMFNLCHWLRVSKDRDYAPLLKQAMPRLMAVSINGADEWDDKPGWSKYIQPLGRGTFDMKQFLHTVQGMGFKGPVGLQCYGITGDTREHLEESLKAWKKLKSESI